MNANNLLPVAAWKKEIPVLLFIMAALGFGIYEFFFKERIVKEGVFTKATITAVEGYKGGVQIKFNYSFNGKNYPGQVPISIDSRNVGRQYFIMLKPENPKAVVFLKDQPVPSCLENQPAPFAGWDKMPACP